MVLSLLFQITSLIAVVHNVETIVNDALEKFNIPGAAVAVIEDDKVVYAKGHGFQQLNPKIPVTEKTIFYIGSCTKSFTAFVLGQLVDEGKVSWDDPVKKYIPELSLINKNTLDNMTIRDLLAHRTGFGRHDTLWFIHDVFHKDFLELLNHLHSRYELREQFYYNNFMYVLAACVIEKVTGQSWYAVVSSRILNPLGMKDTYVNFNDQSSISNFAKPYADVENTLLELPYHNIYVMDSAGGMQSNVLDLLKWLQVHMSNGLGIIQNQTLKEMHTAQISTNVYPDINGYGLGWFVGNYKGCDFVRHGGMLDGFASDISFMPDKKIGVIILTNSSTDGPYAITHIRNTIFDQVIGSEELSSIDNVQQQRLTNQLKLNEAYQSHESFKSFTLTEELLAEYVGKYTHTAYGELYVSMQNGNVRFELGKMKMDLYFKSKDLFTSRVCELDVFNVNNIIEIHFERDVQGNVEKVLIPFEAFRFEKPIEFKRSKI